MRGSRHASTLVLAVCVAGCTGSSPQPTPTPTPTPSTILSISVSKDTTCTVKGGEATITVKRLDPKATYEIRVYDGLIHDGASTIFIFPAERPVKGAIKKSFPCAGLEEGQYDVEVTDGLNSGKDVFIVYRAIK